LQPTDTFLNIGGIQIPKDNEAENSKALKGMSEVGGAIFLDLISTNQRGLNQSRDYSDRLKFQRATVDAEKNFKRILSALHFPTAWTSQISHVWFLI